MSLQIPRFELELVDGNRRITREWYKAIVQIANSIGPSLTSVDDLQDFQNMDSAGIDALAIQALTRLQAIDGQFLMGLDQPQKPDNDLMAFWPGNAI